MANLSEANRQRIWRGLQRHWSRLREGTGSSDNVVLKTAVDYTDAWIDQRQTNYNNGLPEPFKSEATALQKTLLFCAVALMRTDVSFLKQVFGEVD